MLKKVRKQTPAATNRYLTDWQVNRTNVLDAFKTCELFGKQWSYEFTVAKKLDRMRLDREAHFTFTLSHILHHSAHNAGHTHINVHKHRHKNIGDKLSLKLVLMPLTLCLFIALSF